MKTLIYQYYDGVIPPAALYSSKLMQQWALSIGADYYLDHDRKFVNDLGKMSHFFGTLTPIYDDWFLDYDYVLYVDMDVYPTTYCMYHKHNIFEELSKIDFEIAVCHEPFQPCHRAKFTTGICGQNDEKWAKVINDKWKVKLPRTLHLEKYNLLKVYNAGVVLYSNKGMQEARKRFIPIKNYVKYIKSKGLPEFYCHDQNYLHAMLEVGGMQYTELPEAWNSIISPHRYGPDDDRVFINNGKVDNYSCLVHIQLKGNDHFSDELINSIVNEPQKQWEDRVL